MSERSALNPLASQRILKNLMEIEKNPPLNNPLFDALEKNDQEMLRHEEEKKELQKLRESNYIDLSTGCYNRNYWEDLVSKFSPERGDQSTLVLIDINGLKQKNDQEGHQAGDKLIKDTSVFLKENFRKNDLVIRIGGDEFIIVCFHVEDKAKFEEKVLKNFDSENLKRYGLNFAFGIAHFDKGLDKDGLSISNKDNKDKKTTFNRADRLMYDKKSEQKSQQNFSSNLSAKE